MRFEMTWDSNGNAQLVAGGEKIDLVRRLGCVPWTAVSPGRAAVVQIAGPVAPAQRRHRSEERIPAHHVALDFRATVDLSPHQVSLLRAVEGRLQSAAFDAFPDSFEIWTAWVIDGDDAARDAVRAAARERARAHEVESLACYRNALIEAEQALASAPDGDGNQRRCEELRAMIARCEARLA